MISYMDYLEGKTKIRRVDALVLGFMVREHGFETRYAIFPSGRILSSRLSTKHLMIDRFSHKGLKWRPVEVIPGRAEWIGHYPFPVEGLS